MSDKRSPKLGDGLWVSCHPFSDIIDSSLHSLSPSPTATALRFSVI